ncbi:MAG: hypothetical protein MRZ66_02430 [Clostridiales bacterium]|nr:hypothetical protein [Clostridiales bacterium]
MTHPDIEYVERYGYTRLQLKDSMPIGVCNRCGSDIYKGDEHVESYDEIFCDMECCHKYYGIETVR